MLRWQFVLLPFGSFFAAVSGLQQAAPREVFSKTSFVTGASGYVGRAIVYELIHQQNEQEKIVCLVQPKRVEGETEYWQSRMGRKGGAPGVCVRPYDMLDGGSSLRQAFEEVDDDGPWCVYHVASVFGPTENHQETALDNVQGTMDVLQAISENQKKQSTSCRFVLTSSTAAVRGPGQDPKNGKYYTHEDWNTASKLGANWGASYQWSKAEAERQAWEFCNDENNQVDMVSICPSFVFGPPYEDEGKEGSSSSYSLTLVGQWVSGESPVQSRLYVDIRDVAKAHVAAGTQSGVVGKRFLVSTEARIPSHEIAAWLQDLCGDVKAANKIHFDSAYTGGAIPIGEQEVESADRLERELGIVLRPVKERLRTWQGLCSRDSR